jgi:hypothetical protein
LVGRCLFQGKKKKERTNKVEKSLKKKNTVSPKEQDLVNICFFFRLPPKHNPQIFITKLFEVKTELKK